MVSGIYRWTCIPNGKVYVGSALRIEKRRREHIIDLNEKRHRNRFFQRAWNKYGAANFIFEILEYVKPSRLIAREQFWIDTLNAAHRDHGLNLSPTAGSTAGLKDVSGNIGKANKARIWTAEERARRSAKMKGNKYGLGFKRSAESIAVQKTRQTGRIRSEDSRIKSSKSIAAWWATATVEQKAERAARSAAGKSEEVRAKVAKLTAAWWANATPEERADRTARCKAGKRRNRKIGVIGDGAA